MKNNDSRALKLMVVVWLYKNKKEVLFPEVTYSYTIYTSRVQDSNCGYKRMELALTHNSVSLSHAPSIVKRRVASFG